MVSADKVGSWVVSQVKMTHGANALSHLHVFGSNCGAQGGPGEPVARVLVLVVCPEGVCGCLRWRSQVEVRLSWQLTDQGRSPAPGAQLSVPMCRSSLIVGMAGSSVVCLGPRRV